MTTNLVNAAGWFHRFRRTVAVGAAFRAAAVFVTWAGLAASAGSAVAAEPITLKVSRNSAGFEGLILAEKQGYLAAQGLKIAVTLTTNPAAQISGVVSGEFDIAMSTGSDIAQAVARGLPVVVIGGVKEADPDTDVEPSDGLLLPPGSSISDWKDLEGKTIATFGLGTIVEIFNGIALERNGVDPSSVKYVSLPVHTLAAAAKNGQVDGIMPYGPFYLAALDEGFKRLGNGSREFLPNAPQIVWVVRSDFADKNPEVITNFLTAMAEGSDFANSNPEAVKQVYREHSKLNPDFIANRMVLEPVSTDVDEAAWNTMLDAMRRLGKLDSPITFNDIIWKGRR